MKSEDVIDLYQMLGEHGIEVWIDGGWGIDALVNEQTRPHKDLDILARFDDLAVMATLLAERRFTLKEIWSENRWIPSAHSIKLIGREGQAGWEVATAFVLRDDEGREIDCHALTFDSSGSALPAWDTDFVFPVEAFKGEGIIANTPVRCLSAQMQMRTHTGYALQEKDLQDLRLLHERCGAVYLEEQRPFMPGAIQ